jgi:hypothetical protein
MRISLGVMVLTAAMAFSASAQAEGLTGTYRGNVTMLFSDSHIEHEGMVLKLSQENDHLTGTAGPSAEQQSPVANLSAGRKLQFDTEGERPLHYDLSRYGAQWRGDVNGKVAGHAVEGRIMLLRDPD